MARLSIFGCWMFVTNDGKYSPLTVLGGYYTVFTALFLFNFFFNKEKVTREGHYWIGMYRTYLLDTKSNIRFQLNNGELSDYLMRN